MKKLFTLLAAVVTAASAWAAAPELLFGTTPVQPGVTYETGYTVEEYDFGVFVMYSYTQDTDLFIKAKVGENLVVEVESTEEVQVCSIDNQCVMNKDVTKKGALTLGPDEVAVDGCVTRSLQIDLVKSDMTGAPASELLKDITVKVKAYYAATPGDVATATVIMTNKPQSEVGGITGIVADKGSVVPGLGNTIVYNVKQPTKLEIYGVNGALVLSQKIYSTGTVSLDALHPGIYIYAAGANTGKMIVR